MSDQDDAIRACAREAAVQHGGFGNDGMVEVGVTAIRRWLSHRASRPPAPAPTGAALPEFPECAPGPWEPSNVFPSIILDRKRNTVFEVTPLFQDYGERMTVRDFILARVNARLPAPAAVPVAIIEIPDPSLDEMGGLDESRDYQRGFIAGIKRSRITARVNAPPPATSAPVAMSEADRAAVKEYVCGFAFTEARKVALICKARPAWQEGKLNGVGGHIEPGETPEQAMAREFREEAGEAINWEPFAVLRGADFAVHFFRGALIALNVTDTDEPVELFDIDAIDRDIPVLPNLHWLVPMAFNPHPQEEPKEIVIGVALDYASQPSRPQADDATGVK